ncbi:NAD(P)/FAD-dependent oxidoreductase [Chitinimonas koreensis]|uniref:NAD(P)/FAD-dependent oxidoreductase n=1 Tax=Chitinimonas koreensis TaxID=356302 RepID=UPI0004019B95|nr:FAD-dependent oxidoreductase [Chitinimonas koreensis]QNM98415.1 FAD-dependent oxidoreductase [Chitinimonas koreensis]
MASHDADLLIVGAGIVGSALAESCARRGLRVRVVEGGTPAGGTTAAGMGHLVVLDGSPAELALSADGLARWQARRHELPAEAEYRACGTLWIARAPDELAEAERKRAVYAAHGLAAELLGPDALRAAEPQLAAGLAGGLRVPGDAVLYPPRASAWLLESARRHGAELLRGQVAAIDDQGRARLADGRTLRAGQIVLAAGCASRALLPGLPLAPRKGQLLVTERYPGQVRHQLVELGYVRTAHAGDGDSVAFNVQPRATGQLLIGSSRQFRDDSLAIDWALLGRMLARAFDYLPGLRNLQAIRAWTGFRPTTPDKLPLLGRAPGCRRLWLATGHEGLGITTALASAELLADLLTGRAPRLDPRPYDPVRFAAAVAVADSALMETAP